MGVGWGQGRRAGLTVGLTAAVLVVALLVSETVLSASEVAYIAEQTLFCVVLLLAAGISAALALRENDLEARIWFLVASACSLAFISQAYWTWYSAVQGVSPVPLSVSNVFDIMATGLFIGLLLSLVSRPQAKISVWRFAADVVGLFYVTAVVMYVYVIVPWFDRVSGASDWGTILGAVYPVMGVYILVGTVTRLLGPRFKMWSRWERLIAWGVGFLAAGMMLWPVQHIMALSSDEGLMSSGADLAWAVGMFLVYAAAVSRLDSSEQWSVRPLKPSMVGSMPSSRFAIPLVYALVAMILGYRALSGVASPISNDVLGTLAVTAALMFVARTMLVAMEARELLLQAHTDALTGVGDLSAFGDALEGEIVTAERYGTTVSVAMLDLDRMRHYRDIHGRADTENLLRGVASIACNVCGMGGSVYRLGTDRFGIVLAGMHSREALGVVNAVRSEHAARVTGTASTTLSAGIACYPDDGPDAGTVVGRAENALWWAKANGRDRVVVHDDAVIPAEIAIVGGTQWKRSCECLSVMSASIDNRYEGTRDHSRRVANMARIVGAELGLEERQVQDLEQAALLHDLGMVAVPASVLLRKGPLSERQWRSIREHPVLGETMVAAGELGRVAGIVRGHHERWDGRGYPDGVLSKDLPVETRILAVCEAFDAMVSERPYRGPLSVVAALQQIDLGISTQFDPMVAETFIRLISQDDLLSQREGALDDLLRP